MVTSRLFSWPHALGAAGIGLLCLALAGCAGDPQMAVRTTLDHEAEPVVVIDETVRTTEIETPDLLETVRVDENLMVATGELPAEEAAALGPGEETSGRAVEVEVVPAADAQATAAAMAETPDPSPSPAPPLPNLEAKAEAQEEAIQQDVAASRAVPMTQTDLQEDLADTDVMAGAFDEEKAPPPPPETPQAAAEEEKLETAVSAPMAPSTDADPQAEKDEVPVPDAATVAAQQTAADTSALPPDVPPAPPEPAAPPPPPGPQAPNEGNVTAVTEMQEKPAQAEEVLQGAAETTQQAIAPELNTDAEVAPSPAPPPAQVLEEKLNQETLAIQGGASPGLMFESDPAARATENAEGQTTKPLSGAFGPTMGEIEKEMTPPSPSEAPAPAPAEPSPAPETAAQTGAAAAAAPAAASLAQTDTGAPPAPESGPAAPAPPSAPDDLPAPEPPPQSQVAVIRTVYGTMVVEIDDQAAPQTAANFRKLARDGFYNKTTFHRVIPDLMIEGGDPNSRDPKQRDQHGRGGPGYTLPPEIKLSHQRGSVAMARLPNNANPEKLSNGSQFYICVADSPFLDGEYTVFGKVIQGIDVAERIARVPRDDKDNPLKPVYMEVTIEDRAKFVAP